jgi:hypothetical protein
MSADQILRIERLAWRDRLVREIALPKAVLKVTLGLGSGLSRRQNDPPGRLWAIGDRGPNLKMGAAVEHYGLTALAPLADQPGAKVLPAPDCGPTLCELEVGAHSVGLIREMPLTCQGRPISGLPPGGIAEAVVEPAYDIGGEPLANDPDGADTEGVCALDDGSFWVSEEYGPSLLRVDGNGEVLHRWTPRGGHIAGARIPTRGVLPAVARTRRLNRGFEAVAGTPDGKTLYVIFQSALDGEDRRETRLWALDGRTGRRLAEYLYPFDALEAFRRDAERGPVHAQDLKVCDLCWLGPDRLLVLERLSRSAKVYSVELRGRRLHKTLVFDSDRHREVAADLEGMAMLNDRELILVNDNDFGTEGAATAFFRIGFKDPL